MESEANVSDLESLNIIDAFADNCYAWFMFLVGFNVC